MHYLLAIAIIITFLFLTDSLSVKSFEMTSLKSSKAGNRLAFIDQSGRFTAQADSQEWVTIPNLSLNNIRFADSSENGQKGLDFGGKLISNVKISSNSIAFETIKDVTVDNLAVSHLTLRSKPTVPVAPGSHRLVFSDSGGNLLYSDVDVTVKDRNSLDLSNANVIASNLTVKSHVVIDSLKSVSLLGTDGTGKIVDANGQGDRKVGVGSLEVGKALHSLAGSEVFFHGLTSSLLVADENGRVTSMLAYTKDLAAKNRNNILHLEVLSVQADKVRATSVQAHRADFTEIFIEKEKDKKIENANENRKSIIVGDKVENCFYVTEINLIILKLVICWW